VRIFTTCEEGAGYHTDSARQVDDGEARSVARASQVVGATSVTDEMATEDPEDTEGASGDIVGGFGPSRGQFGRGGRGRGFS